MLDCFQTYLLLLFYSMKHILFSIPKITICRAVERLHCVTSLGFFPGEFSLINNYTSCLDLITMCYTIPKKFKDSPSSVYI